MILRRCSLRGKRRIRRRGYQEAREGVGREAQGDTKKRDLKKRRSSLGRGTLQEDCAKQFLLPRSSVMRSERDFWVCWLKSLW